MHTTTRLVDSHFGADPHAYTLTRVYHLTHPTGQVHPLRIEVHRDFYPQQSHARAQVLATGLTWTTTSTPDQWHPHTPTPTTPTVAPTQPNTVADQLLARAQRILNPPDTIPIIAEGQPS